MIDRAGGRARLLIFVLMLALGASAVAIVTRGRPARLAAPVYGHSLDIGLISGLVIVRPPHRPAFRLGATDLNIPIGSLLDTRQGRVDLRAASAPPTAVASAASVKLQEGRFAGGEFAVRQTPSLRLPQIRLAGGSFASCAGAANGAGRHHAPAGSARSRRGRLIRLLHATGPGRFETAGRSAAASVRGTIWLTADYCHGTLVSVTAGVVAVRNLITHRTLILRAGQSYFARAG